MFPFQIMKYFNIYRKSHVNIYEIFQKTCSRVESINEFEYSLTVFFLVTKSIYVDRWSVHVSGPKWQSILRTKCKSSDSPRPTENTFRVGWKSGTILLSCSVIQRYTMCSPYAARILYTTDWLSWTRQSMVCDSCNIAARKLTRDHCNKTISGKLWLIVYFSEKPQHRSR